MARAATKKQKHFPTQPNRADFTSSSCCQLDQPTVFRHYTLLYIRLADAVRVRANAPTFSRPNLPRNICAQSNSLQRSQPPFPFSRGVMKDRPRLYLDFSYLGYLSIFRASDLFLEKPYQDTAWPRLCSILGLSRRFDPLLPLQHPGTPLMTV